MSFFQSLFLEHGVAQTISIFGLVIAFGFWFGRIKVFGISLGVTWILFLGIFASYLGISVNKELAYFLRDFGLLLFVYCIGLQIGPGFFSSLKKTGLSSNILAMMIVVLGVTIAIICHFLFKEHIVVITGLMSGAVTNTPGLGAAQSALQDLGLENMDTLMSITYALAYPFGVLGIIFSILFLKWIFRIDLNEQRELHRKLLFMKQNTPISINLKVENRQLVGKSLRSIFELLNNAHIVVSRVMHEGHVFTPTPNTILYQGDILLIVTQKSHIPQLKMIIGEEHDINLKEVDSDELISKHALVTRSEITHKRLGDITALHQQGFTLSRIERAGIGIVPNGDTIFQLGDKVKIVGTKEGVELATKVLGNSIKRLETPDLAPIFIGIVLGVILGSIPFAVPNVPIPIKIGLAGGPLIVALILSSFGNRLYLNNYTTNSANLMVRDMGISLFLASVGLTSGSGLAQALSGNNTWLMIIIACCITIIPLITVGIVAKLYFKKTYFEICGLLSGSCTDPPALAFSMQMAKNDVPSVMYSTVYPLSMILRIIAAELLILFFMV